MSVFSKKVNNNGVHIEYLLVHNDAPGIPLLLIPGMINSAEEVHEALSPHLSCKHIIISLRGRGNSDSPESGYSLDAQASDIRAVVEAENIEQCYVFGHSIGSTIALRAFGTMPEKVLGFVMGDFPPFYPPYNNQWAEQVLSYQPQSISEKAVRGISTEATEDAVVQELNALRRVLVLQADESASYACIREEDVEKFAHYCPMAQIQKLSGIGHEMLHENPQAIAALLSDFIKEEEKNG